MNLKKRLELGQSKVQACEIVDYVNGRTSRFKELVEVYLKGPYRVTQRAARPLTICAQKWPYLVEPHFRTLIDNLHKSDIHDAVIRNTIRLLQFVEIPKRYEGKVADLCFGYLQDRKIAVAIRVFSLTVLYRIAMDKPDIKNELKLILEDQLPHGSAALKSRGLKILMELNKENSIRQIKHIDPQRFNL